MTLWAREYDLTTVGWHGQRLARSTTCACDGRMEVDHDGLSGMLRPGLRRRITHRLIIADLASVRPIRLASRPVPAVR